MVKLRVGGLYGSPTRLFSSRQYVDEPPASLLVNAVMESRDTCVARLDASHCHVIGYGEYGTQREPILYYVNNPVSSVHRLSLLPHSFSHIENHRLVLLGIKNLTSGFLILFFNLRGFLLGFLVHLCLRGAVEILLQ